MNKYDKIINLIHDLKFELENKGILDKEIEVYLLAILKEIDHIREEEQNTKREILNLLYKF